MITKYFFLVSFNLLPRILEDIRIQNFEKSTALISSPHSNTQFWLAPRNWKSTSKAFKIRGKNETFFVNGLSTRGTGYDVFLLPKYVL